MTSYADYAFYTDKFLGKKIPAEEFGYYALLATQYINSVTFDRIVGEPIEAVKMACCAVAENYFSAGQSSAKAASGIASEKVGSYSVSYATASKETANVASNQLYNSAKLWLGNTGLMYKGV